jgi:hypothetical protein
MWPTYYGMTQENFPPGADAPNLAQRAFRFFAYGAQRRAAVAPRDGQVSAPLVVRGDKVSLAYTIRQGRSWLVPADQGQGVHVLRGRRTRLRPGARGLQRLRRRWFLTPSLPDRAALMAQVQRAAQAGQIEEISMKTR